MVEFIILYFGMLFQSLGGGSEVLILTNLLSEIQPTPLQSSNFNWYSADEFKFGISIELFFPE